MKFTDLRDALRAHLKAQIAEGATTGLAIAAAADVRQAHVSNFLNGKRGLSFEMADRLLEIAGLEGEDLIAEELVTPRKPFELVKLKSVIAVPIVEPLEAMRPRPQQRHVKDSILVPHHVLETVRSDDRRSRWTRLIALRRNNGEYLIIDRCRFAPNGTGKYAAFRNGIVEIGRLLEVGRGVVFCPDDPSREASTAERVIGRVVMVQTCEQ